MLKLIAKLQTRLNEDKGATMIEYGMICGLIIGVVATAMVLLGGSITNLFGEVDTAIDGAF